MSTCLLTIFIGRRSLTHDEQDVVLVAMRGHNAHRLVNGGGEGGGACACERVCVHLSTQVLYLSVCVCACVLHFRVRTAACAPTSVCFSYA